MKNFCSRKFQEMKEGQQIFLYQEEISTKQKTLVKIIVKLFAKYLHESTKRWLNSTRVDFPTFALPYYRAGLTLVLLIKIPRCTSPNLKEKEVHYLLTAEVQNTQRHRGREERAREYQGLGSAFTGDRCRDPGFQFCRLTLYEFQT